MNEKQMIFVYFLIKISGKINSFLAGFLWQKCKMFDVNVKWTVKISVKLHFYFVCEHTFLYYFSANGFWSIKNTKIVYLVKNSYQFQYSKLKPNRFKIIFLKNGREEILWCWIVPEFPGQWRSKCSIF